MDLLQPNRIGLDVSTSLPALRALLRPFLQRSLVSTAAMRKALTEVERREANEALAAPGFMVARAAPTFDDADTRYVANAGLCLLWPFLPRFFANLALLGANDAFIDPVAQHRAAALLHHIATGESAASEHWLSLNKILCGLDLSAVSVFAAPVTAGEGEEAERMIAAAIAHAACLGTISPEGFRGSFLLRKGALVTRDGAWLLRVDRQVYDVVLDGLPWRIEWIRLPWMAAPLRVEW